jgi:hypothetical protein
MHFGKEAVRSRCDLEQLDQIHCRLWHHPHREDDEVDRQLHLLAAR